MIDNIRSFNLDVITNIIQKYVNYCFIKYFSIKKISVDSAYEYLLLKVVICRIFK